MAELVATEPMTRSCPECGGRQDLFDLPDRTIWCCSECENEDKCENAWGEMEAAENAGTRTEETDAN